MWLEGGGTKEGLFWSSMNDNSPISDISLILAEEYWVFTENLHVEFQSVLGKIEWMVSAVSA